MSDDTTVLQDDLRELLTILGPLSEAATQGEASAPDWGTDFRIGGKLAGMMSPAYDGNGKNDRAFVVAAINFARAALAKATAA